MQHPKSAQPPSGADHQARLEAYLRELKLPIFLQLYQTYAQDAARSGLSSERFLLALCEAARAERRVRRIEHAIATAKFPFVKEIPPTISAPSRISRRRASWNWQRGAT